MSKTKDIIISLIIGEVSAWLLVILAKSVLSDGMYETARPGLKLLPAIFPVLCVVFMLFTHLISKKIGIFYQIGKFVLIGGFNTLIDWGVLSLAIFIFRSWAIEPTNVFFTVASFSIVFYSLYKAISFVIAATNSFFWNKFWTFKRQATEKIGREFLQFFIVTFLGFLLNVSIASGIFKLLPPFVGLNQDQWGIFAAVVATAISMFWNFLGYKFVVFNVPRMTEAVLQEPPQARTQQISRDIRPPMNSQQRAAQFPRRKIV
jgi:putative flippase GtrA